MRTFFCVLSVLLLLGVSSAAAQPAPDFEPIPCPDGITATECGYVSVPEDHANPDGAQIRLAVAISRAENAAPDPLFFLVGGPGEDGLVYSVMSQFITDRDVVVFDQRGAGRSEPTLACTEYTDAILASATRNSADTNTALIDAIIACGERMTADGIPLAVFNATQSAADVDAIRQALGYDQINLWGTSYGTRLAEEVMRSYPGSLRSVILDSVIPPEIDRPVETAPAVAGALASVFAACAADADCNAAYPQIAERYQTLVARLDAEPYLYTMTAGDTTLDIPISGGTVAAIMLSSMYSAVGVAQVPFLVDQFSHENYAVLESAAASQTSAAMVSAMTMGMFFATECRGEVAYSDADAMASVYETLPEWRSVLGSTAGLASERVYEICARWNLTMPSGEENTPLESDVPTLVMTGEFDPATPPAWVALAADGLSQHYAYIIPGQAHGPGLTSECGFGLAVAFLADPTHEPDTACLASGSIDFTLPDEMLPAMGAPEATETVD
jgi:pimeloyl-ACP methyl ester carboxylesterase